MTDFILVLIIVLLTYFCLRRELYIQELEDQNFLYSCRVVELEARINEMQMQKEAAEQVPLR